MRIDLAVTRSKMDYSQYGQALILEQLIATDTPSVLVDIGANDGVCGSNSRALLEKGWTGVLVEPLPRVFEKLKRNSSQFPEVTILQVAVSHERGHAPIFIGRDGDLGQLSSLSQDPLLLSALSEQVIQVPTVPLADVLAAHRVPEDFGVLLIDTEGWDLNILQGLEHTSKRPRIIVTEDFKGTNEAKYRLLAAQGYQYVGFWGSDSFWVNPRYLHPVQRFGVPAHRCPPGWPPTERDIQGGVAMLDQAACFRNSVAGWAWNDADTAPSEVVYVRLQCSATKETIAYEAWRTPRPDVAQAFNSDVLMFSGFRAFCDVAAGPYEVTVIQADGDYFVETRLGSITIPL